MFATASARFEQKRECPQGTRATPERGAIRQTSHIALSVVAFATAAVTVAVAADDGAEGSASSSSTSSSEANWTGSSLSVLNFVVDSRRVETCFVSSFWLCEVRHFPGLAFSSHCFFVLRHFQVLQIQRPHINLR